MFFLSLPISCYFPTISAHRVIKDITFYFHPPSSLYSFHPSLEENGLAGVLLGISEDFFFSFESPYLNILKSALLVEQSPTKQGNKLTSVLQELLLSANEGQGTVFVRSPPLCEECWTSSAGFLGCPDEVQWERPRR